MQTTANPLSRLSILALPALALALEAGMSAAFADELSVDELPAYTPDANTARADIPDVYKWDLTRLFPSDQAWEQKLQLLEPEVIVLSAFHGQLADGPALLRCLDHYFRLHGEVNQVTLYAGLRLTTARTDEDVQSMNQNALALMDKLMGQASFIRNELLALSDKQMAKAYKKAPGLEVHRGYIENLRRRKSRVLGEEAERVLGLAGDNLWAEIDLNEIPAPVETVFHSLLDDIPWPMVHDAQGNEVQLTLSNYGKFRRDADREVRREAVEAFLATLRQYEHALAATLGGQAQFSVMLARARGYDTARQAYLDKDNLDTAVYDNLIKTVNANLEPLHRYVSLRKKALGYDEIHLYDLYIPMVGGAEPEVPFSEGRAMVLEALQPLGEDYMQVLEQGLDPAQGWLDLYPSAEKRSGAFSASVYDRPPYVMMNYQDSMNDLSTLAHEYGHALHSHLSMEHQGYADYRYVPFLAEIASTANEALVERHLLANASDDRVKASILADRLATMRGTIYRQALFAEFEWQLHEWVEEGTPVTASLLEETYAGMVQKYYGPDYALAENDGMEWAYIPHFYWKYYVFTYATGLSSGIAIAQQVLEGEEGRDAYLGMLQAGCSAPPLEILAGAGVDLTTPAPIEAALKLFDETVTELEALLPSLQPPEIETTEGGEE